MFAKRFFAVVVVPVPPSASVAPFWVVVLPHVVLLVVFVRTTLAIPQLISLGVRVTACEWDDSLERVELVSLPDLRWGRTWFRKKIGA